MSGLDRVCTICGDKNEIAHQDFCWKLGCSGRMVNMSKPRIKFYGNGDVYMECYDDHKLCYPNSCNITYRTPFISFSNCYSVANGLRIGFDDE